MPRNRQKRSSLAYDSGALKVEGVGVVKVITLAVGNADLSIARMIGVVKI